MTDRDTPLTPRAPWASRAHAGLVRTRPPTPRCTVTTLTAGDLQVVIDAARGARIASFRVGDHELLVTGATDPLGWGGFVMAPWAGRIRDGVATWDGRERRFATDEDGHGLHGFVHDRPWAAVDGTTWRTDVSGDEWFAPLRLTHHVSLAPEGLTTQLTVEAPVAETPATVGWHPWFVRRLTADAAPVSVELPPARMRRRDADGIATSETVDVPAGPWDDAFVDLAGPITLRWPGQLALTIDSDAAATVVYTERDHAVCVEPQTGPPDEVNQAPRTVRPGHPMTLTARWTVTPAGGRDSRSDRDR